MSRVKYLCLLLAAILCLFGCAKEDQASRGEDRVFSGEDILEELKEAGALLTEKVNIYQWANQIEKAGLDIKLEDYSVYNFFYESGGLRIESYIAVPLHLLEEGGAKPCLIYNHGGNRDYGALNGAETLMWANHLDMICIASNFRGCGRSEGEDAFGGDDVNDVIRLIDICEKCDFLDSGRINMLGASRGGMMTYETLRRDDRIHRAVVTGGVADAFMEYESRDDMKLVFQELVGGTPETMPEEYERRSAVRWADEINTPLFIIHAREDARVGYEQAENMVAELEKYGKEYVFLSYDDDLHAGIHREDMETVREWFLKE